MKFVMIREYSWDLSKDKVIVGTINEECISTYISGDKEDKEVKTVGKREITLAYLSKMGSFNEDKEYNILVNTDSIQIRPKAIYKNNMGYYRKEDGKRIFLGDEHTKEVEEAILKFSNYLKQNPNVEIENEGYKEIL